MSTQWVTSRASRLQIGTIHFQDKISPRPGEGERGGWERKGIPQLGGERNRDRKKLFQGGKRHHHRVVKGGAGPGKCPGAGGGGGVCSSNILVCYATARRFISPIIQKERKTAEIHKTIRRKKKGIRKSFTQNSKRGSKRSGGKRIEEGERGYPPLRTTGGNGRSWEKESTVGS